MLLGQLFNDIDYQRWPNVSNTLTEGRNKVRDVIKHSTMDLDAHDNEYPFTDKFQENWKATPTNKKSRLVYTDLHRKMSPHRT